MGTKRGGQNPVENPGSKKLVRAGGEGQLHSTLRFTDSVAATFIKPLVVAKGQGYRKMFLGLCVTTSF